MSACSEGYTQANRLVSAMHAADPTTRAAFPRHQLSNSSFDMIFPGLRLLGAYVPANPLITRKWRQILPSFQGGLIRYKSIS